MFDAMIRPCIHPDYPRYKQSEDGTVHYTALISAFQADVNAENNLKRNMIYIDAIVTGNDFTGVVIELIQAQDDRASPALWRGHLGDNYGELLMDLLIANPEANPDQPVFPPRLAYRALLAALKEQFKKQNLEGVEEGVGEC